MSVAVSVSRPTLEASLMTRAVGENTPKGGRERNSKKGG